MKITGCIQRHIDVININGDFTWSGLRLRALSEPRIRSVQCWGIPVH